MRLVYYVFKRLTTFLLYLVVGTNLSHAKFVDDYSNLKKFLDKPIISNYHIGFGVSPFGLIGEKSFYTISLFQLHYISGSFDFNIISADFGVIESGNSLAKAKNFTIKTSPKYVLAELFENTTLSLGPLFGVEFIKFDNVKTQLRKGSAVTVSDNLSAYAAIWGAMLEQTVTFTNYKIKISQTYYRQNYSITDANNGWYHFYENVEAESEENQKVMQANDVFLLSLSMIF